MLKFLVFIVIMVLIGAGIAFYRPYSKTSIFATQQKNNQPRATNNTSGSNLSFPANSADSDNLTNKLDALEKRVKTLEEKNSASKNNTKTTSASSNSSKTPLYILALGSEGGVDSRDWTKMDKLSATINPSDYSGYKNFQLEVELQQYQGNGTAFARLFNSTDGVAVPDSEVSTGAFFYTWVGSPKTFALPSGSKSYILELKSSTGFYHALAKNFRVKVNY